LKIAIVTPFYPTPDGGDPGGIGIHFYHLAMGLLGAGQDVEVFQFPYTGEQQGTVVVDGIRVHRFEVRIPKWFNFRGFGHLARMTGYCDRYPSKGLYKLTRKILQQEVEEKGFEVIETTSNRGLPFSYCRFAGRKLPVITRVSTTMAHHFKENQERPDYNQHREVFFEKGLIGRSDALVTHTKAHAQELEDELSIPASRFAIIPHGIKFPSEDTLAQSRHGSGTKNIEILYVGRFEQRKGIDVLLDAIPQVLAEFPNVRFLLAGNDPGGRWETGFRAKSSATTVSNVKFLGRVGDSELQDLYNRCDIFTAPSRYESFGLVFAEAMAYGKPVVGCNAGGMPEVIGKDAGFLAEPGSSSDLADCLASLARSKQMRKQMGQYARQRVLSRFGYKKMATDTLQLYKRLLSGEKPIGGTTFPVDCKDGKN